jgi:hypothetical protein
VELRQAVILVLLFLAVPMATASAYQQTQTSQGYTLTLTREGQAVEGMRTDYILRITDPEGRDVENALIEAQAYHQVETGFLLCTIGGKATTRVSPLGGAYRVETVYLGAGEGKLRLDITVEDRNLQAEFIDQVQGLQEPAGEVVVDGRLQGPGIPSLLVVLVLIAASAVLYIGRRR